MPQWTQDQVYQTALQVGFAPDKAATIAAISMAETGGNPRSDATNPNGEYSVGPLQINLLAHGNAISEAAARDLTSALQYAYDISGGGADFTPWSAYTGYIKEGVYGTPTYLQYLNGGGGAMPAGSTAQVQPDKIPEGWEPVVIGGQLIGFVDDFDGSFHPVPTSSQGRFQEAQVTGTTPPSPASAVEALFKKFEAEILRGSIPKEDALDRFKQEFDAYGQVLERSTSMADIIQRSQEEAGRRGTSIARDVLPSATTVSSLNVPYLNEVFGGSVPGTKIDVAQLFDQGAGQLMGPEQVQELFPAQPDYEPLPNRPVPEVPDIAALINQIVGGFPGFQVMPQTKYLQPPAPVGAAPTGGAPPVLPTPDEVARAFGGILR